MVSGPEVKKVMTKSSRLRVKASRPPATRPGVMCGIRMSRKMRHSPAPRSLAASSSSRLNEARRARMTMATKLNENEMCEMMIAPRFSGQGRDVGQGMTWVKKTSMATPMQISGTTIGRASAPSSAGFPGKRKRQRMMAVIEPRIRLTRVETAAMVRELPKATIRSVSWKTWM